MIAEISVFSVGIMQAISTYRSRVRKELENEARNDRLEAVQSIREPLKEVVDATRETETAARQISASSDQMAAPAEVQPAQAEEVTATSEQIARSVQSMSTAARESAAGVTEVSDAAEDLDRTTNHLKESASRLCSTRKSLRRKGQSGRESRPESRETGDQRGRESHLPRRSCRAILARWDAAKGCCNRMERLVTGARVHRRSFAKFCRLALGRAHDWPMRTGWNRSFRKRG